MITQDNITKHEMIGMNVKIIRSTNPQIVGLNGTVVDETKSMFTLKTVKGFKMVAKKDSVWEFLLNNGDKSIIEGKKIAKRPHERMVIKQ